MVEWDCNCGKSVVTPKGRLASLPEFCPYCGRPIVSDNGILRLSNCFRRTDNVRRSNYTWILNPPNSRAQIAVRLRFKSSGVELEKLI
jgi:predicted amidophosphoribosyltransferase